MIFVVGDPGRYRCGASPFNALQMETQKDPRKRIAFRRTVAKSVVQMARLARRGPKKTRHEAGLGLRELESISR
jgi:hypothetical protein